MSVSARRLQRGSGRSVTGSVPLILGHWDSGRPGGSLSNLTANSYVDSDMANELSAPQPVSQLMRGYASSSIPSSFASSPVKEAASFQNAAILNTKSGSDYAGMIAGNYNTAIQSFWASVPLNMRLYVTWQHEPENDAGIVASDWRAAVAHFVDVSAAAIRARGLTNCGAGGLLMGSWTLQTSADYDEWGWWREVQAINRPQTVFMIDDYAKMIDATTSETRYDVWGAIFDTVRADGITRFLVGETGISRAQRNSGDPPAVVGTSTSQRLWIENEVPRWRNIPGLEAVCYFHAPTGPASQYDQLANGEALAAWAQASTGVF